MTRAIAILSSASGGGAGIAAKRLCDGLNSTGKYQANFVDVNLVGESISPTVCLPGNLSNHKHTNTHFTAEHQGFVRGWLIDLLSKFELINVHWASYLVSVSELQELAQRGMKILFTMHDFYYSTGGCHYPAGCTGQTLSCRTCPQVNIADFDHASVATAFRAKQKLLNLPNVHVSAPSRFVVESVERAGLIPTDRGHVIRNIYEPLATGFSTKQASKQKLLLIADSLSEKRKGMELALAALHLVSTQNKVPVEIHVVGNATDEFKKAFKDHGLSPVFHGRIEKHAALVDIYRDVGLMLTCSYEDNWPNILVEAGSYGVIPIVGSGHGCEEFCRHFSIGKVVDSYTPDAFANAISAQIEAFPSDDELSSFSDAVRTEHATETIVDTYEAILSIMDENTTQTGAFAVPRESNRVSENYLGRMRRPTGRQSHFEPCETGPFSDQAVNLSQYGLRVLTEAPSE